MNKLLSVQKFNLSKNQGFTLIEVILVLAVGSLIFAMAFIAYGQASANRRDTQRRADLGKIASELENYASDYNGKYPEKIPFAQPGSSFKVFVDNYISGLNDPSSQISYTAELGNPNSLETALPGVLEYFPQNPPLAEPKFCDGTTFPPSGNRDYVIRMKLEKGVACRDSRQ